MGPERFSEEQIKAILKGSETGPLVAELCREQPTP